MRVILILFGVKVYRQAGAIPPIRQGKYPKRLVVFDTEAYRSPPVDGVELQTLRLGVAMFIELDGDGVELDRQVYNFTTPEGLREFILWQTRKDKALYVYAHNLRYDLQLSGLYAGLVSEGWQANLFVIESPPTFIKLRKGRLSIILVDTFNYWQFSVKAMGEQLGLNKLQLDEHLQDDNSLFEYCLRDVNILANYLLKFMGFLRENDLAGLGLTLASQAFRSFRYKFMRHEIVLHNHADVLQLERDGYTGGRCEAFYIGNPNNPLYYKLDVNSMYPYIMKGHNYPVELVSYAESVPVSRLKRLLKQYYCIADVDLETSTPLYAYSNGIKLLFPTGKFRTVLHHAELVKALELGDIKGVNRLAIYNQAEIFTPYVDYFYTMKVKAEKRGDKITRHQAKIFLNSLYGKFGQREVVSKIVPISEVGRYERLTGYSEALHQNVEVNYLGNVVEVRYKAGEAYYSSPVIAGAVTANARVYLWELITQAGLENCYYVDTDSLIVNQAGAVNLRSLRSDTRLGALKLEGLSDKLYIHGAKDYVFGDEVKVKGVPKSAIKLSDNLWQYEQFRGAKTWLSDGQPDGVEVYTRLKERRGVYDKGVINADGTVSPLLLGGG